MITIWRYKKEAMARQVEDVFISYDFYCYVLFIDLSFVFLKVLVSYISDLI